MSNINEIDGMWNGEVADGFKKLEAGIYRGEISDYRVCQVGQKNTWAIVATIDVTQPESYIGHQLEKIWYVTPGTMPYLARDLKELECPIFKDSPLSEQLQKLPLAGKLIDFKYDIPKGEEYHKVMWINLAKNSATIPQGASSLKKPITSKTTQKTDTPF